VCIKAPNKTMLVKKLIVIVEVINIENFLKVTT